MKDTSVKRVITELEQDGWPEASENAILLELARQLREASPSDRHLGETDDWRQRAEQLARDVLDRVETKVVNLDSTVAESTIDTLTVLIIHQCLDLITRACGGQQVSQQCITIIAAFIALVVFQRLRAR